MSRHAETSAEWTPDWIEWLLRGIVAIVILSSLALLWRFLIRETHNEDRQVQALRTSMLSSYGDSKTTEAAYDFTAQCLSSPHLNEDAASLVARCQSLSLSYIDKGSFPETEKQAAHRVITDLSTKYIQQGPRLLSQTFFL